MSFRRDGSRSRPWKQWLASRRDTLVAAGIPDWVYSNERRWHLFLEDDGLDWESGWRVEMLSTNQAEHFQSFLMTEYGNEPYRGCLRALELHIAGRPEV